LILLCRNSDHLLTQMTEIRIPVHIPLYGAVLGATGGFMFGRKINQGSGSFITLPLPFFGFVFGGCVGYTIGSGMDYLWKKRNEIKGKSSQ
jgi:hypothetical protein